MPNRQRPRLREGREPSEAESSVEDRLKKRPPRLPKTTSYVIEIAEWSWRYSFGAERSGLLGQSMVEYRAISLKGALLHGIASIRSARALVSPDPKLDQVHELARLSVGTLRRHKETIEAFLDIPTHSIGPILQTMLAGRFNQLAIEATEFITNEADVLSFAFQQRQ